MPLPVIVGVLIYAAIGGAVGGAVGAALGAAIDFFIMDDRDTQAVSDWLNTNNHSRILNVFVGLVHIRTGVRRLLGIRTTYSDEVIVRETFVNLEDLPPDVRQCLAREGRLRRDVTSQVELSSYAY